MPAIVSAPSAAGAGKRAQKQAASALPALAQPPGAPGRILVRRAIKVTAEHFGTTPDVLVSACRTRQLCRRRQVAMYVARIMTGRSFPFIGSKIGDRHYTTILHGVRVIKRLLDAGDAEMAAAVRAIMDRLCVTSGRA